MKGKGFPYPMLDDARELATFGEWSEDVYLDFAAYRAGRLSEADLQAKYHTRVAILCLDMTGFTEAAIRYGELESLMRIFDVQRVCGPVLREHNARLVRAFADDLTALFDDPRDALEAALQVHERVQAFNASDLASPHPAETCIGIGYGDVYAIGPNLAMGDEMNRASKLGEDTARANETLVTQNVYQALLPHRDYDFQTQNKDDLPFPFYAVTRAD